VILIVTNRQDYTADFLILELQRRQAPYIRFNTEDFPQHVQVVWRLDSGGLDGRLVFANQQVGFRDISSVWYRRPVAPVSSPGIEDPAAREFAEAESLSALDGVWRTLDCFWVSDPDFLRRAELKLYQLKVASLLGFVLSPTLVTNSPQEAHAFYREQDGNLIYKPLRRSRLTRDGAVSLIYTNPVGPAEASQMDKVAYAPCLLQTYVQKQVEVRVTVIGKRAFGVAIHSQEHVAARHDWRRGDTVQLRHEPHKLPSDLEARCVALVQEMGLAFGAIDLILTPDGEYVFLEINPNGQWAWIQQLCPEIPLREALADLLINGGD